MKVRKTKRIVHSAEERADCVKQYGEGISVSDLGAAYGVSRQAIYQWIAAARGGSQKTMQERIEAIEQQLATMLSEV